jgi:hypothetical protein
LLAEAWDLVVPTGGAYDDSFPAADAGFGVGDYGCGRGEVDDYVEGREKFGGQCSGIGIFVFIDGLDVVTAGSSYFFY